ncbi:MAG: helix-turn-helix domain-containing protein [Micrococcus sp.]|nr:helix-turn-helix domain-containing protein [Micrococcus sp.]
MNRGKRPFTSVADMAEHYAVSADVVYRKVETGEWPASRIGRMIRFSPDQQDEIERLVVSAGARQAPKKDRITEALLKLTA